MGAEALLERCRELLADLGIFGRHPRDLEQRLDPPLAALRVVLGQKSEELEGDRAAALFLDRGGDAEEERKRIRVLLHLLGPERLERVELLGLDEVEELRRNRCRFPGHEPLIVA